MNAHSLLLPLNQMARRLRVTNSWLRSEADAGRVPCLKADKRYLFAPNAVERALAKRATLAGSTKKKSLSAQNKGGDDASK